MAEIRHVNALTQLSSGFKLLDFPAILYDLLNDLYKFLRIIRSLFEYQRLVKLLMSNPSPMKVIINCISRVAY